MAEKRKRRAAANPYLELRRRQKAAAAKRAERILPVLERDKDWKLVTGKEDHREEMYRAITRVTKRAVNLLQPDRKVSVRRGRGTAYGWVHVDVAAPELDWTKLRGKAREKASRECDATRREINDVLVELGIRYSTYYTDCLPGADTYEPCLSVTINGGG